MNIIIPYNVVFTYVGNDLNLYMYVYCILWIFQLMHYPLEIFLKGTVPHLYKNWRVFRTSLYQFNAVGSTVKDFLNQEDFCKRFLKIIKILRISLILMNKSAKFIWFVGSFNDNFRITKYISKALKIKNLFSGNFYCV